ncbi:von Willebrand factor type A domain-containing protein [Cribrihabitans marinus]|uniref:von Willebrand factor type A domain-containing protein n=1 Tax=Cribrihabitans marinus TaxID=1227549 RepID=A0A1H6U626_9RHOB|nr:vWA domain-containing protein [Cribrihabitans marinus]SEI83775.1 von Willebrand factor type A domain-containing protein [Cribrihabitans marinus]
MITAARAALVGFALALALPPGQVAANDRPLLVEDRKTVFQRVLTRPGAVRHAAPEGQATRQFPAFQPLYVYAERDGWLQVGPSSSAGPEGWVRSDQTVAWKQNIVGAFTNAAGRERQFLFRSEDDLRALMEHEALQAKQAQLLEQARNGTLPAESGIVAVEPGEYVNIVERLYLMPILDFAQDLHPLTYEDNLLMEVASVPLNEDGAQAGMIADSFDAGIVFVFDTTMSMDPYIERTQRAVQKIVEEIRGTEIGRRVEFGVVAFRDNADAAPGLEYRTKTLLPLERRADAAAVVATIRAATDVARANSPGFNEDSLAGVEDAVELTDWEAGGRDPFDARIVVLITDAGPKDPRDPNARSQIGPAELQRAAQDKGVAIMTLHLQTPAGGAAQHAWAERQYRALSRFNDQTYYYGIPDGSPAGFETTVTRLVTALTDIIRVARDEQPVLAPAEMGGVADLGLAMRLAYLGRLRDTQAPDVIRGWVSEKAVEDPARLAIEPRLLVTRNEMATMADLLSELLELGERSRNAEDAAGFFGQVRAVVSRMAQNPDRLLNPDTDTLGGALEFLQDLPYESQLMLTTEARWQQSAMIRRQILDGMRQKLVQYRKWLLDPDVWTPLYDAAPDGEHVFAMPFDVLP